MAGRRVPRYWGRPKLQPVDAPPVAVEPVTPASLDVLTQEAARSLSPAAWLMFTQLVRLYDDDQRRQGVE